MAEHYPNSLFKLLGVTKEVGLKAIRKSKLNGYQLTLLYKRWGEEFDGTKKDPNEKLSLQEAKDLKKVLSIINSRIYTYEDNPRSSIIIEHTEEVNKYMSERKLMDSTIYKIFPEYNTAQIKPIIINLLRKKELSLYDNEALLEFLKNNKDLVLSIIKEKGITESQKSEILSQNDSLFLILINIRDKYYSGVYVEELIIATKIAMKRNSLDVHNCIDLINFALEKRSQVYLALKSEFFKNNYYTLDCILYNSNEERFEFLQPNILREIYYSKIAEGELEEDIIINLAEQFKVNKKLIMEILNYQNPNKEFNKGDRKRLK